MRLESYQARKHEFVVRGEKIIERRPGYLVCVLLYTHEYTNTYTNTNTNIHKYKYTKVKRNENIIEWRNSG